MVHTKERVKAMTTLDEARKRYSNARCPKCELKVMWWDIKENMNLKMPYFGSITPEPCFQCKLGNRWELKC